MIHLLVTQALLAQSADDTKPTHLAETHALTTLAERGHAVAQFNLGIHFDQGHHVPQDFAQAAKWYRRAAQPGHAGAQFNLGGLYVQAQGMP